MSDDPGVSGVWSFAVSKLLLNAMKLLNGLSGLGRRSAASEAPAHCLWYLSLHLICQVLRRVPFRASTTLTLALVVVCGLILLRPQEEIPFACGAPASMDPRWLTPRGCSAPVDGNDGSSPLLGNRAL